MESGLRPLTLACLRLGGRQLIGMPGNQLWTWLRSRRVCHERRRKKKCKRVFTSCKVHHVALTIFNSLAFGETWRYWSTPSWPLEWITAMLSWLVRRRPLLTSCSVCWMLLHVLSLERGSSTVVCHSCSTPICTGSTFRSECSTNSEWQCTVVCNTRHIGTWSTVVHRSPKFPLDTQDIPIRWTLTARSALEADAAMRYRNLRLTLTFTSAKVCIARSSPSCHVRPSVCHSIVSKRLNLS